MHKIEKRPVVIDDGAELFLVRYLPLLVTLEPVGYLNLAKFGGVVCAMAFTFLGYRRYELTEEAGKEHLRIVGGSGLGILREREGVAESRAFASLPPPVAPSGGD